MDMLMKRIGHSIIYLVIVLTVILGAAAGWSATSKGEYLAYIGTYTGPQSKGIYVFHFDAATGHASEPELAAEIGNPSWVTIDPTHRFLYAVSEYNDDKSALTAFSIDSSTGKLKLLNTVPAGGNGAVHVSIDATGRSALVANYFAGNVAVRRIREDGSLGEQTGFDQHTGHGALPSQKAPLAHSIFLSPNNRFALSPDKGIDKVLVYRFDASRGTLALHDPPFIQFPGGSGPRHLAFHPNGKFVYVITEMGRTVTTLAWDERNGLAKELQTISALSLNKEPVGRVGSAEVRVSPDGKFLYASNRGPATIGVFSIQPKEGTLTPVEQVPTEGEWPRSFTIDPTGSYLLVTNQNGNNVVIFRINRETGRLTETGQQLKLAAPVCVTFLPLS
jgi:6-phosphogluconolactonase